MCMCVSSSLSLASSVKVPRHLFYASCLCVCVGWKTERFCPEQTPPPDCIRFLTVSLTFVHPLAEVCFSCWNEWMELREGRRDEGGGRKVSGSGRKARHTGNTLPMKASLWPSNSLALPFSSAAWGMRRVEICVCVCVRVCTYLTIFWSDRSDQNFICKSGLTILKVF